MGSPDDPPSLESSRTSQHWRPWAVAALAATAFAVILGCFYVMAGPGNALHDALSGLRGWYPRVLRGTKVIVCLVCAVLVVWPQRGVPARRASLLLKLAAVLAMLGYFNFGTLKKGHWIHYWEMFHYQLGSKYFPELGYDGLYFASLNAQDNDLWAWPARIRDLRTNEVVETAAVGADIAAIAERFSPERLAQFRSDHLLYVPELLTFNIRLDHGYNPTPTWTFVARLFDGWLPSTRWTLLFLSLIDQALLAGMWVFLFRTYGSRTGCLAMTVFGLSHLSDLFWTSGSLLRFDWLVAVVVGVCLLKRDRHFLAGISLGYAAMVRIFPVLFLVGPAVVGLRALLRKEDVRWLRRFATGYALAVALGFTAGCLTGRGVDAWSESFANLRKHQSTWLTNNVGLRNTVLYGADTFKNPQPDRFATDPWASWRLHMTGRAHERRPALVIASLAALAIILAAAWRYPLDEATVLGTAAAFSLLLLTCYYWVMLLLVPLRGGRRTAVALLLLNAGLFAVGDPTVGLAVVYGAASWALALLMALWLLPDAIRTLRRTPTVPALSTPDPL